MVKLLGFFKWSVLATIAALVAAYLYDGMAAVALVALLIAIESSISFDNAVVNAEVLRRMSRAWQQAFLTIGIVIAVVGMRLVFPIMIVVVATGLGTGEVIDQAFNDKQAYAENVEGAAPLIGAFGGIFLLMVALDFFLDPARELHWLRPVERRLAQAGQLKAVSVAVAAGTLVATSQLVSPGAERDVLLAGLIGIITYLVIGGLASLLEQRQLASEAQRATGAAGFASFAYLETLDASFSLDGVLGGFAISTDIVIIALGLGVGAIYVRSLTVYLVRRGTLSEYRYLKHGAHWAIGALAVVLLVSIEHEVPEWLTGTIGIGAIGAAYASSVRANRSEPDPGR